jgi:hypothetical protein
MKWFRMFDEAMDDPKLNMLTSDQFRFWFKLVCLANRQKERGTLPPDDEIPLILHLRRDAYGKMISALEARNLFVRTPSGRLKPTGWDERQRDSDDAAKRKARYREKTYGESDTSDVPGHERDTERDTSGTCPAPRARASEILDLENPHIHTGVNSKVACTNREGPNHAALPSTRQRTGDNARDLAEAEKLLGSDPRTEALGMALSREHNTPELIAIEGWRFLRAAERILGPGRSGSQRNSLRYLATTARNLTEAERNPVASAINGTNHGEAGTGPARKPPSVARRESEIDKLTRMIEAQESVEQESASHGDG